MALRSPRFKNNLRLQNAFNNNPPLKLGEIGLAVRIVQEALVFLGYPLPKSTKPDGTLDGVYGTETKKTIETFQRKNNLVDDGIMGENTLAALDNYFIASPLPAPIPLPKSPAQYELKIHLRSSALAANSKYSDPNTDTFAETLVTGRSYMMRSFQAARTFYKKYNIHLKLQTEEILKLTPEQEEILSTVRTFCQGQMFSEEQNLLFSFGPPTGLDEVTAFFVYKADDPFMGTLAGCASWGYIRPVLLVTHTPMFTQAFAHELGHLLLGKNFKPNHIVTDPDNLMCVTGGPINRSNLRLNDTQLAQILKSPLLKQIS